MNEIIKKLQDSISNLFGRAAQLSDAGDNAGAIAAYQLWLSNFGSTPLAYPVYFNLGVLQANAGELAAAEQSYRSALAGNQDFLQASFNLGNVLEKLGRFDEALACWAKLTCLGDEEAGERAELLILALNNSGRLLENLKRYREAEDFLTRSLKISPDQHQVIHHWVHLRQRQCNWPVLQELPNVNTETLLNGASAMSMLDLTDDPELQLSAANRYVLEKALLNLEPLAQKNRYNHQKIRVGYLSSDFSLHPVSMLIVEMLELHDRDRFQLYGYCWSPQDGSGLRQRVLDALDVYTPVGHFSDAQAAQRIRLDEIDILVDLQGLTAGARINILAHRPAPIQIAYLGFPGTSGMPFIDYILCDHYVLPEEERKFYTEKPLYLPGVFQVCDTKRPVGAVPTRASCGLPEKAFVFCAFNNTHKYTPELFAVWLNILGQVPNSVLWLLGDNPSVEPNLRAFAATHGIESERLIFATRVLPPEYLARYALADLFLDCFPFNGGTTANDALWSGVPLLTCSGRSFASRMAGSLLTHLGLHELIAHNLKDYEEQAIALANDAPLLQSIRQKLNAARTSCALFSTQDQVRNIEARYTAIVDELPQPEETQPTSAVGGKVARPGYLPNLNTPPIDRIMSFASPISWGITDPERFLSLMNEVKQLVAPGYFLGDNLFTWGRNNSLFDDETFKSSWAKNQISPSDEPLAWRRYILACAAFHCVQLPGDFVECGVYMGSAIKTVVDYLGGANFPKSFWAYDTFDTNPTSHTFAEQKIGLYDRVVKSFTDYPQVRLVKGLLPDSLKNNSPESIAYLHIDLNSAKYEIAVLEVLFDRLVPGGILVLDDYEWGGVYREQKILEDRWFDERGYRVFPLPTGQGVVLKR